MTGEPIVAARGVGRTYGLGSTAIVAVHDATCEVRPGDAIAVVGPSGSGKSTLLHLLAGLDAPTVGSVTWPGLGADPRRLRPGTVGVVFQGPSLLPDLDALENVMLPLLLAGEDERAAGAAASAALERLGLGDVARHLPEELSGGQAQRVAVARALASAPRLLFADEPTGQLDSAAAAEVVTTIEATAAATGAAVVVSTHDPTVAERFPVRWRMRDGALDVGARAWSR
jgi:putative ABC transport system ATP-binding protein